MDFSSSSPKIERLRDDSFHTLRCCIKLILSIKELEEHIVQNSTAQESENYTPWCEIDHKSNALIGLTPSDVHHEKFQHANSAKVILQLISDIYEKYTLLNKLSAGRRLYTAKMNENEKVLMFSARIRQLASSLKYMGAELTI